tara:strand:+ start:354 stop:668 length:315 start_codon:yes stop_codon:yes gene_type:complete
MVANSKVTMSKRVIQANIEKEYDAKVLKMFIGKDQGKPVYFVRVMFNGGNYNTAFQVNTIVIDAISGKRLPQFRHGSSGRQLSGAMKNNPNKQTPGALRGHVWR